MSKTLLLIGSPRGKGSNSYVIGKFLASRLEEQGFTTDELFCMSSVKTPGGIEELLRQTDEADIIILATPLYVDSLPSYTIRAMELIHDHRKGKPAGKQLLVGILNCGFPEPSHNDIALDIICNFADESALKWGGAVRVGMGEALNGKLDGKGMGRRLAEGLSSGALSLSKGEPMSAKAEEMLSRPLVPLTLARLIMVLFVNRQWNKLAKGNNAVARMCDKPYEVSR